MSLDPLIAWWANWRARRKRLDYYARCVATYSIRDLVSERRKLALYGAAAMNNDDLDGLREITLQLAIVQRQIKHHATA